jgi:phosphosulfolactate synthase (CoM biosynthesis protein A)
MRVEATHDDLIRSRDDLPRSGVPGNPRAAFPRRADMPLARANPNVAHAMTDPGDERALSFLRLNQRQSKPRTRGVTEMRGPYYTPAGPRYLEDVLEQAGDYVDTLKFAGGSFALMRRRVVRAIVDVCHRHEVKVSTGGFLEFVLTQGASAVERYFAECKDLGFDVVEISAGFIAIPDDDLVRLTERALRAGLVPKPEVGIQFGAGGATAAAELEAEGTKDAGAAIQLARRHLAAGASMIMIESEGITENVRTWRTDVIARIVSELGLDRVMFEAADPEVFAWYVKTHGPEVNLFVDHSQVVQLECMRSGIWGPKSLWGRVLTYR